LISNVRLRAEAMNGIDFRTLVIVDNGISIRMQPACQFNGARHP
jgi:hypothetical protein